MSRHFIAHQQESNDVHPVVEEDEPVRFSLGWDEDDDIDEFGDFSNVLFHKVPSNEIVYDETPRLPKFVGGYLLGDTLGEGSYARVKEALDTATIRRAAVKIMKKKKLRKIPSGEENMKREIALLQKLSKTPHPNIIELFDVQCKPEKEKTYLFMTFCCCSLQDMLDDAPGKMFPIWQAHKYITQTLHGLSFLHCKHIIHKDIKPANLLLDPSHTVKICDFGVAEELDPYCYSDSVRGSQGAPMFVAPEIAVGMETVSGRKLDVWSTGVSLFNFVTGTYPFNADNVFKLFKRIEEGQFTIPTDLPEPLQDLLGYMLKYKYEERYCIEECLNHRWILRKQSKSLDEVPMPSKIAQESTLIQYLEELHVDEPEHCHHHDPTTSLRSSVDDVLSNSGGDTTRSAGSQPGPPKSASRHCRQQ